MQGQCPICNGMFEIQPNWIGKSAQCPFCKQKIIVQANQGGNYAQQPGYQQAPQGNMPQQGGYAQQQGGFQQALVGPQFAVDQLRPDLFRDFLDQGQGIGSGTGRVGHTDDFYLATCAMAARLPCRGTATAE